MGETCTREELRTLFLFEALSDKQLDRLRINGHSAVFEPGILCVEGEPATRLYVLIDGELAMSKRLSGEDIETIRTSQRGVYVGAWSTFIPHVQAAYARSVRVTKPARFFVIDGDAFARFIQSEFPMAVHLLEGQMAGGQRSRQIIGQREKLLALGTITAGLTHQLNNPAAATARAVADLREDLGVMRHKLALLANGECPPEALRFLVDIQDEVSDRVTSSQSRQLSSLEATDREERLGDWLEDHGILSAVDYAPAFVDAGLDVDWLERVAVSLVGSETLQAAVGWLHYTIKTELLMKEIADASERISKLLAAAKQYSQMDRAPYQSANVHDLLRGTLETLFGDRVGDDRPIKLVKEWDELLPEITCYPGDLNEVWTNLIDNAIQAMSGAGTLTIRTKRESEATIRVEFCDDGVGIPEDDIDRIFTPFFTTMPFGEGTGLGLDLARRIVVEKHRGDLRVQSEPGDTRFIVLLPMRAPAPETTPLPDAPD